MEKSIRIRYLFIFFFSGVVSFCLNAQNRKMDRLEQYYDQGHYKMVYRKSVRMLSRREYDYSILPSYYRAMSSFHLINSSAWMRRHQLDLKESIELMNAVMKSPRWPNLMKSHAVELADMELLFDVWLASNASSNKDNYKDMEDWIIDIYKSYEYDIKEDVTSVQSQMISEGLNSKNRLDLIHYAYEFMGLPYKWGGIDENGFDCSGFTRHVFQFQNIDLPRVSKDQYRYAKPIDGKRAYRGDLVFFSDGKEISHVGILVNEVNEPKIMIHSSSSKGISVADINESSYWGKRLVGFGRVVQ